MKKKKGILRFAEMEKELNKMLSDFVNHDYGGEFGIVQHVTKKSMANFLVRCLAKLPNTPTDLTVEHLLNIQIDSLQEGADSLRKIRDKQFEKLDKEKLIH